eukprot:CAMPEP_0117698230 /NCGR_PEP_ID=MMETSP0804-20121206/29653_1 /TAXON_ID=1074897 /ORGANISM="Tetraselmis astigmatica, Strain CCMP880" /LENGTH=232 /DNA_ID=CAMNT_0005512537 /DNA_START=110 /DNA_END=806 /DNA_ORIENTATION=+
MTLKGTAQFYWQEFHLTSWEVHLRSACSTVEELFQGSVAFSSGLSFFVSAFGGGEEGLLQDVLMKENTPVPWNSSFCPRAYRLLPHATMSRRPPGSGAGDHREPGRSEGRAVLRLASRQFRALCGPEGVKTPPADFGAVVSTPALLRWAKVSVSQCSKSKLLPRLRATGGSRSYMHNKFCGDHGRGFLQYDDVPYPTYEAACGGHTRLLGFFQQEGFKLSTITLNAAIEDGH